MSNQEITGNSSFEGEAVMPENSSSSEEGTTDSTLYSSVTSDSSSSSEEAKTPEPPIVASIGRATQTEEPPFCGICYTDLTLENNVTTNCGHHFCSKCFFRWIEVNATCPSCRAPIDSKTNLTDQQLNMEYTEVYTEYTRQLQNYCRQMEKNKDARMEWMEVREKTNEQLKRQIRLREQMMETEGYNEGFMAAAFEFFHGTDKKYTSRVLEINRGQRGFMRGFMAGASQESRRLDRMAKEYKRYKNRKIKMRKRKVQKTLWDCGVYEKEDPDPFRNVTVGESDDDDEEMEVDIQRDAVEEITEIVAEMEV
jgi:hypothetical protein